MGLSDWAKANKPANVQHDAAAVRRARDASRKADKASKAVEEHWKGAGPEGRQFAHAKAADAHLKAARAAMAAGDHASADRHTRRANEHLSSSEQARDELGRFASTGAK